MAMLADDFGADLMTPIEVLEQIISAKDWPLDRTDDVELATCVTGSWCDYHLCFSWCEDLAALHLTCTFDIRIPANKHAEMYHALGLVNESLWMGHFDLWNNEGVVMFRHNLPLAGTDGASTEQCEDMINAAISACEKYFPAFQFVLWAGKTAQEAVAASMLEPVGEA